MRPAGVRLDGWGWRHAGRAAWATSGLSLSIEPGERVLLLGASGAGKSTLLHALAGVLGSSDEGEEAGSLTVDGARPRPGDCGLVMQDPDAQTILARVGDDVAFGLENLSVPRDEIWPRVRTALAEVGLDLPLDHSTERLSGGQRQRLALAGALAMRPGLLLLDEPTANLDPVGVDEVRDAVGRLVADRGTTLVVVEHRIATWLPLVDRVVVLAAGGGVVADGPPDQVFTTHGAELAALGAWVPGIDHGLVRRPAPQAREAVLTARALTIGYEPCTPVRTVAALDIPEGVSTTLTGANGSGKTTLALTLAGLLPSLAGQVQASASISPNRPGRTDSARRDPASWRSKELLTRLGTVFQDPEHQFVAATVSDELAIGLRALGRARHEIQTRVDELLEQLHLGRLARANPFTLSGGEKRRLSVGTVLATSPAVVFLDEPTFGQDRTTWVDLVRLVTAQVEAGTSVVSVTHDTDYLDLLGEHHVHLEAVS
ncbi:MAG TPA: ABC transporter ATP-binding protein [Propionibacteriaceae bacterium]|nr:ABC transporter ATP-binding protein [Propionibacteriaceae bacterium]